jgi:hypothetical protein
MNCTLLRFFKIRENSGMTDRKKGRPPRKLPSGLFMTHPTLHGVQYFSDSQEIHSLLWYLKVHYCVHSSLSLHPILSQMNQGSYMYTTRVQVCIQLQTAEIL